MKNIALMVLLILVVPRVVKAQMFINLPKSQVGIVIDNDSYITIKGKTNVNGFTCEYKKEIPQDTISINIRQSGDKMILTNAILQTNVDGFDCGNQIMNKDFKNLLKEKEEPYITLQIKNIEPSYDFIVSREPGLSEIGFARVEIALAGAKNEYLIPLNSFDEVISQYYMGQLTLNITDFQLDPPKKFLGLVKVEEEITVDFKLNLNFVN